MALLHHLGDLPEPGLYDRATMPVPVLPARPRRIGVAAGTLAVLVVLLLSDTFGRADPTNNYRPAPTVDALETGCFPLPGGARLDGLAYQIRRDRDIETADGPRRELRGQYDLVGRDEAMARIVDAFTAVGFRETAREEAGATLRVELTRRSTRIQVFAADLPGTTEETLVRGQFRMDLPVIEAARDDPICSDPKSTKRWGDRHPVYPW